MPYNYKKLLGKMREEGLTQELLAKKAHIGKSSLNLKLNNNREFRQGEMIRIFNVLKLPDGSMEEYFFNEKL